MKTFGERFLSARKKCKFTQAEVAEKLNVSFQAVSLWERGETFPDIGKLPDIAKLFNVSTDWLLEEKTENEIIMDIQASLSDRLFDENRMYTYVKTYASIKQLTQTLKVLPYAKELHKNQYRKGKDKVPYIYHPLMIACHALALGLDEDNMISAAMLHDVSEDCGVPFEDLPVNDETREAVALLTHGDDYYESDEAKEKYFAEIAGNRIAIMIKLLDRCNNVSGMATGFPKERMIGYIQETEKWIYPLFHQARNNFPQYSNQVFLIKYHMTSVVETIKHQL